MVDEVHVGRGGARAERLLSSGLEQHPQLGVAVAGLSDCVRVHSERDVVQKRASVHVAEIDRPFQRGAERIERANALVWSNADIAGEVIPRTGGDTHKRNSGRGRSGCHDCQRAITSGDTESRCAVPAPTSD